jgi:hypothetical protein
MLWNLQPQYCIQYSLSLVPVQSQMNPVHIFPNYLCKIYFNIICSSMPVFPEVSFLQVSQPKLRTHFIFHHDCHISCLNHPSYSDYPNNIWQSVQIFILFIMQFSNTCQRWSSSPTNTCNTHIKPLTWPHREASSAPQFHTHTHKATHMATPGSELCTTISHTHTHTHKATHMATPGGELCTTILHTHT